MKKTLIYSVAALLIAGPAFANPIQLGGGPTNQAQTYGGNANANRNTNVNANLNSNRASSRSSAYSNSRSTSRSSATGGNARATGGRSSSTVNVYNGSSDPAGDPAGEPAGDPSSGGGHGPRIPVSSAEAPAVMSFNPCSGSPTSGAAQFAPFGLSFGTGGGFDNSCRLHMLGQDAAAAAYLCRVNGDIRQAFKDIGQPCPQDRPKVMAVAAPAPAPREYRYDYCYTASAGELKQHRECFADGRL